MPREVFIYAASGTLIKKLNGDERIMRMPLNDLQNGLYLIRVLGDNGQWYTGRFVKE